MTLARKQLISIEATPYYHCISRCVRQAYLCGQDSATGKNYDHRRKWIEERILYLADHFLIDVAAYAVMHNHYHIVLRVNKEKSKDLKFHEVIQRWKGMFKGNALSEQYLKDPDSLSDFQTGELIQHIEVWRERLYDISWFMRCLNEYIARTANFEDKCKGRFWEGRFKSQALLDEKSVLACMAYVDLNPIRANVANSIEEADFTSISKRLSIKNAPDKEDVFQRENRVFIPFKIEEKINTDHAPGFSFSIEEYIELLNWTIENITVNVKTKERSSRKQSFTLDKFQEITNKFEELFKSLVGSAESYNKFYHSFKFKRRSGYRNCEKYFGFD